MLLATDTWDLVLDVAGNWAVATDPYAIAQDVASAVRLFKGEQWFDTIPGVPYFDGILGVQPNLQYVKAQIEAAALTVPGVVRARCLFASFTNRVLSGQVQITDTVGVSNNVTF